MPSTFSTASQPVARSVIRIVAVSWFSPCNTAAVPRGSHVLREIQFAANAPSHPFALVPSFNPQPLDTRTHTYLSPSSAHLSSPSSSSSFFHSSWTNRERSFLPSSGFPLSLSRSAVEQHRQTNINDRPGKGGEETGFRLNRRDGDPGFLWAAAVASFWENSSLSKAERIHREKFSLSLGGWKLESWMSIWVQFVSDL